jgi:hypothetical protein
MTQYCSYRVMRYAFRTSIYRTDRKGFFNVANSGVYRTDLTTSTWVETAGMTHGVH